MFGKLCRKNYLDSIFTYCKVKGKFISIKGSGEKKKRERKIELSEINLCRFTALTIYFWVSLTSNFMARISRPFHPLNISSNFFVLFIRFFLHLLYCPSSFTCFFSFTCPKEFFYNIYANLIALFFSFCGGDFRQLRSLLDINFLLYRVKIVGLCVQIIFISELCNPWAARKTICIIFISRRRKTWNAKFRLQDS